MKKRYLFLVLFIAVFFGLNVSAQSMFTVNDDELLNDNAKYDQTQIRFGDEIRSDAEINGLNITFGKSIKTSGKSEYAINFGESIEFNETVKKDTFLFARSINIGSDATINRDVYLFAEEVKVNAALPRNVRIYAENVDLSNVEISGNVSIYASSIDLTNTRISGNLKYVEDANVVGLTNETVKGTITKDSPVKIENNDSFSSNIIVSYITKVIGMFLIVIIVFKLFPRIKRYFDNYKAEEKLNNLIPGLIILFLVPLPLIILMFTGFLTRFSIITFTLYIVSLFLAVPFMSYLLGKYVFKKFNYDKINEYLQLFISLLVINILFLLPVVGGLLRLLTVCYFLGFIYDSSKRLKI